MKIEKIFVLIACLAILPHCSTNKKQSLKKSDRKINPLKVKNLSNDTSLSLYTLTCTDTHLIATDGKTNRISIFNYKNLNPVHVIGRTGHGPGEFDGASYTASLGNKIYVGDGRNRRINVFNKNSWTFDKTIPHVVASPRFVITKKYLYVSGPIRKDALLMKVNLKNGNVKYFGKWPNTHKPKYNRFYLLSYKKRIIAISSFNPMIQFYNKQGKLLASHSLKKEKALAKVLAYKRKFRKNPNNRRRAVLLFGDASIYKNFLILNYITRPKGNEKTNNYLVYRIEGNNLKKVIAFKTDIHNGFTYSFCTHKDIMYTNGGPHGINIFAFDLSFLNNQ